MWFCSIYVYGLCFFERGKLEVTSKRPKFELYMRGKVIDYMNCYAPYVHASLKESLRLFLVYAGKSDIL